MNIFSKFFSSNHKNGKGTEAIITKTITNNGKISIEEKTMEKPNEKPIEKTNTFQQQRDLMRIFQDFYDENPENLIFQSCWEANVFSNAAIYLQQCGEDRRISMSDIVCFFQRSEEDLCGVVFELVSEDENEQDREFATDLLYFLSEKEAFKEFKDRLFKRLAPKSLILPDLSTFKVTGSMSYMLENDALTESDCGEGQLQNFIDGCY